MLAAGTVTSTASISCLEAKDSLKSEFLLSQPQPIARLRKGFRGCHLDLDSSSARGRIGGMGGLSVTSDSELVDGARARSGLGHQHSRVRMARS